MTVEELNEELHFEIFANKDSLKKEISTCFVSDLLSFVMGYGKPGSIWVTVQAHMNVIAVAVLKEFSLIIVTSDVKLDKTFIDKALKENIPLMKTTLTSYEVCKRLVNLGI